MSLPKNIALRDDMAEKSKRKKERNVLYLFCFSLSRFFFTFESDIIQALYSRVNYYAPAGSELHFKERNLQKYIVQR